MTKQKVFIVGGGGMVGASAAYALALQSIIDEIILIDINQAAAWGQAADIADATAFSTGITVRAGDYSEINDDDIVIITSGAPQKPGQSRLELLNVNTSIMRDVVDNIMKHCSTPFIMVVANPVDALTYVALKQSRLPKSRVFGSGTTLDTFRLRVELARHLGVADREVDAYVLGEHGDSSFVSLSGARVGDIPLANFPGYTSDISLSISQDIRDRVYKIIDAKKSTYFAIGQVIARLVDALRHDSASIYPVCSLAEGEYGLDDVVIGLPSQITSKGVKIIAGYPLDAAEQQQLAASARVIQQSIQSIV